MRRQYSRNKEHERARDYLKPKARQEPRQAVTRTNWLENQYRLSQMIKERLEQDEKDRAA